MTDYIAPTDAEIDNARANIRQAQAACIRRMFEILDTECWNGAAHWSPEKGWH